MNYLQTDIDTKNGCNGASVNVDFCTIFCGMLLYVEHHFLSRAHYFKS